MAEKIRARGQATVPGPSVPTQVPSRQVILDAALRLAGERGYVGTTMALVKRATGLPASSLYWHFASKDELLTEALEHGRRLWHRTQRWESAPADPDLYRAVLANLRRTTSGATGDGPAFLRMGLMVSIETGPAVGTGPHERFCQIRSQMLAGLERWWSRAVDLPRRRIELLAHLTLAALDGLFLRLQATGYAGHEPLLQRLAAGLVALADHLRDAAPVAPSPVAARPVTRTQLGSRERLIEAVMEVAADSGYEGASISRICTAAGLPASSIYWHFGSKEDLFASAIRESYRSWGRTQADWRTPPASGADWPSDLTRRLTVTIAGLDGMPSFLRLGYLLLLPHRSEPLPGRDTFVDVRRQASRDFAEWLRGALGRTPEDPEPGEMGELLLALCDGLAFADALDHHDVPTAQLADALTALVVGPATAAVSAHITRADSRH